MSCYYIYCSPLLVIIRYKVILPNPINYSVFKKCLSPYTPLSSLGSSSILSEVLFVCWCCNLNLGPYSYTQILSLGYISRYFNVIFYFILFFETAYNIFRSHRPHILSSNFSSFLSHLLANFMSIYKQICNSLNLIMATHKYMGVRLSTRAWSSFQGPQL